MRNVRNWSQRLRISSIFSGVFLAATALSACSSDDSEPGGTTDDALRGRACRSVADCPLPGAPCQQCTDGSVACPEVSCVRRQCAYEFNRCASYDPCAGKSCGDRCTACDPADPTCIETSVIKFCQADRTCAPSQPSCGGTTNPCAAVLCPPSSRCVVLETQPPQAKCVPVDACATVRCAAGTHCVDGKCVPDKPAFCGGIAGFPCPAPLICIDDPSDDCDPNAGGADCGGICVPKGERCGSNICGQDQFCCNASCGICAPKGGACIQIAC